MWMLKRTLLAALFLVLLGGGMVVAQEVGGTVNISIVREPDTLDPHKTSTSITGDILRYLGDTILTKDLNGAYAAGLAESWSASDDGLTWTFTLQPGIQFHDGTPVNAEAVRASIERARAPETQSPIAGGLFEPVANIEVIDDRTFEITLDEPFAPFLDNLTDPRASIVNVEAAEAMGNDYGRAPVLTGPWRFSEWRSADRIILERNPDYAWAPAYTDGGTPYIETLVFRVIPEAATQVAAFEANEVQILNPVPPTDVLRLQQEDQFEFVEFLKKGVGLFMEFNVNREPFDELAVRQALNHAIDKDVMVSVVLDGLGVPAHGILPPSIWGYWDGIEEYSYDYDPERAIEILEEAGWTRGADGIFQKDGQPLEFTLEIAPRETWTRTAQIAQGMFEDIGVRIDIQGYELGTLLERLKAGEQQANLMGYTYPTPDVVHLWFHSSNIGTGLAHSHFEDETLDEMIERSRTETANEARLEVYREIQQYINDQALWVPLWTNFIHIGVHEDVQNTRVHPDGFLVLLDAYLE